jgi:hypothetical protein
VSAQELNAQTLNHNGIQMALDQDSKIVTWCDTNAAPAA